MSVNDDRIEQARIILRGLGQTLTDVRRVNDVGDQIRTREGTIFTLFDKGTIQFQGKTSAETKAALEHLGIGHPKSAPHASRDVFVVYGHDRAARDELERLLLRWDLNPIILDQEPAGGLTLIEKLEFNQARASFAVVLLTPDDEGHAVGQDANKQFRARQNVVLELGMVLSKFGRSRVVILYKGPMELPSDINGFNYLAFKGSLSDIRVDLAREFVNSGIEINLKKL